jgi:hypothetical protein
MSVTTNVKNIILCVFATFFIFLIIHHTWRTYYTSKENFSLINEVGTNEVGTNEVGTNEVGTNEVGTNEVGTNEVGTNEVVTNEVVTNEVSNTLFVSIPSYRDADCKNTVNNLFETAKNPELIYIGIFTQNKDDSESCKIETKYKNNIRYLDISYKEAKGPLYARARILKELYKNESYYMMIDAHTRFTKDWDFNLKKQLEYLRNSGIPKPILSTYPSDQINMEDDMKKEKSEINTTHICGVSSGVDYPQALKGIAKQSGIFYKSHFIAAGFLFTYGQFCKEARLDTTYKHIFEGEEILLAILAYTNGWDIYSPPHNYVYHKYKSVSPPWFSDNKDNDGFGEESRESHEKLKRIMTDPMFSMVDPYGIGRVRGLDSFWQEVGFNRNETEFDKKWTKENEDKLCNKSNNIVYNE